MRSGDDHRDHEWDQCFLALESLAVPVFITSPDGHIVFGNLAWIRQFGEEPSAFAHVAVPHRERVRRAFDQVLASGDSSEVEVDAVRSDGTIASLVMCSSRHLAVGPVPNLIVTTCCDVTDKRRNEERLAFMAGHDPLTGLANRRNLEESLARSLSRVRRGGHSVLLMLDMDRLKAFNDLRGHLEGDQALVNLAMLLRRHVRAADLPARIGGDEFAVLLEEATADEALEIAERIRVAAGSEEFVHGAREHGLGVSGGIAIVEPGNDARTVLDRADAALYEAKRSGRSRIVVWGPELATFTPERLASRVGSAFANDGFFLVYQPVVRLSDGEVAYFESLVRMRDRDEVLAPGDFLPVVESLGLMPRLTLRLVESALWQLAITPAANISVNLSASDINDDALLENVEDAVARTPASERLLFELSEEALLSNLSCGRRWMERLSRLGCRFVLDGFGTGIGMFVLLREPEIEQVKLSRTVMRALAEAEANRIFVGALRELIEAQGKTAVAGYLDSDAMLAGVASAGFQWGQGFRVREPDADLNHLLADMTRVGR